MSAVRDYARTVSHEIDFDRKVMFLGSSEAYADGPSQIERIETRFSWVFLTDRHVYKLKNPGRRQGFDFTSPERRPRNAEEEVRLNPASHAVRLAVGRTPGPSARSGKLSARRSPCARRPPAAIFATASRVHGRLPVACADRLLQSAWRHDSGAHCDPAPPRGTSPRPGDGHREQPDASPSPAERSGICA